MALIDDVKDLLSEHSDGVHESEVAGTLGNTQKEVRRELYRLKKAGLVTKSNDDLGVWFPGGNGLKESPDGGPAGDPEGSPEGKLDPQVTVTPPAPVHKNVPEPPPNLYDAFKLQGATCGVQDPLLEGICSYIFQADAEDLQWVWDALSGMSLRPDIVKRWYKFWAMTINRPIPDEVKKAIGVIEDDERKKKGLAPGEKQRMRYTVSGDRIFPDVDGDFENPIEAQKFMALSGVNKPTSAVQDLAAMTTAMAELTKGNTPPIIDIAAIMREMKQEPKDNSDLIAMFNLILENQRLMLQGPGGPPEPKKDTIGQFIELAKVQPTIISTIVGVAKGVLGISAIEEGISRLSANPAGTQAMLSVGQNGMISLPDYKELQNINLETEAKRAEMVRAKEKHDATLSLFGKIREELPKALTSVDRAIARQEQKNANKQKAPKRRVREEVEERVQILEGYCPHCEELGQKTVVSGPPNSTPTCPACGTMVQLKAPAEDEGEGE